MSDNSIDPGPPSPIMPAEGRAGANSLPHLLKAGDRLGDRFIIIRFLSQGGMGEVYEASDLHLQGTHLALKTLRLEIGTAEVWRSRFEREVLLAREVPHPT